MKCKTSVRVLAALMAASLLFGACNNNQSSSSGGASTASSNGSTTSEDASTPDAAKGTVGQVLEIPDYINPAGEFPIMKETTTYKIAVIQSPNIEDYATNYETLKLKEIGNMEFEFEMLPTSEAGQKFSLAMASLEMPDAYFGISRAGGGAAGMVSVANLTKYGDEGDGQLISLNDLIETYGENTKALYEKYASDGFQSQCTSADGNIYFMPVYGPSKINRSSAPVWYNMGWLEKLNKQAPTTTDELYDLLVAFRDGDPNGNGKKDEIPAVGTADSANYDFVTYVLGAFMTPNRQNYWLLDDNGTVTFGANSEAFREGLKFLNKLGTEGLISQMTFTQDTTGLKQLVTDSNDIVGAFTALGVDLLIAGAGVDDRYIWGGPVKGPQGVQVGALTIPLPSANGLITSSCEKPEGIFRLMDWLVGEEGSTLTRYGVEGENYEIAEEGFLNAYGEQATIVITNNIWQKPQNTNWQMLAPAINDIHNDGMGYDPLPRSKQLNAEKSIEYMKYEPTNQIPLSVYTLEETEIINEIRINLDDFVKEALAKFTIGEWDPNDDAAWDKYLKELEAIGLADFLECSQAAFDRANG
jgi:putative aldouronate transport system substrate-binding protein